MIEAGDLYRMLRDAYGPQGWWSDDPYTVMFQSVLVQNTSWGSVIRDATPWRAAPMPDRSLR